PQLETRPGYSLAPSVPLALFLASCPVRYKLFSSNYATLKQYSSESQLPDLENYTEQQMHVLCRYVCMYIHRVRTYYTVRIPQSDFLGLRSVNGESSVECSWTWEQHRGFRMRMTQTKQVQYKVSSLSSDCWEWV